MGLLKRPEMRYVSITILIITDPTVQLHTGTKYLQAGLRIRIHLIQIRIQYFSLNTGTDPDPIQIRIQGFNDQKLKKITAEKI